MLGVLGLFNYKITKFDFLASFGAFVAICINLFSAMFITFFRDPWNTLTKNMILFRKISREKF